jgi:hypothetical protein
MANQAEHEDRANFCRKINDIVGTKEYTSPEIISKNVWYDASWEKSAEKTADHLVVFFKLINSSFLKFGLGEQSGMINGGGKFKKESNVLGKVNRYIWKQMIFGVWIVVKI